MSVVLPFPGKGDDAEEAWAVHQALLLAEARDPSLADNARWRRVRSSAYQDFEATLQGSQ